MDIEAFVKTEAPSDSTHDKAYAAALREVYESYKDLDRETLVEYQKAARYFYRERGPTHHAVASCMVLNEMLS